MKGLKDVVKCTIRDSVNSWSLEIRFKDGQKYAAVEIDYDCEELAEEIAKFINDKCQGVDDGTGKSNLAERV